MTKTVKIIISDGAQDVGMRAALTAILIENGFEKGKVKNVENHVEVIVEANKNQIGELKEIIEEGIDEMKKENDKLPGKFTVSKPKEVELNPTRLPALSNYANALQLKQMSKFVGVGKELGEKTEQGFNNVEAGMEKGFTSLEEKTEKGFTSLEEKTEKGFNGLEEKTEKGFNKMTNLLEGIKEGTDKIDRLANAIENEKK